MRELKKAKVIKKNYAFNRVYRRGQRCHGRHLCLYLLLRRDGQRRLGVTVSRKLRGAVTRNRMKRYLRELFRLNQKKLRSGFDMILMGRSFPQASVYQGLEEDFLRVCRKHKLLCEEGQDGQA